MRVLQLTSSNVIVSGRTKGERIRRENLQDVWTGQQLAGVTASISPRPPATEAAAAGRTGEQKCRDFDTAIRIVERRARLFLRLPIEILEQSVLQERLSAIGRS